jgi:hypothetical protein
LNKKAHEKLTTQRNISELDLIKQTRLRQCLARRSKRLKAELMIKRFNKRNKTRIKEFKEGDQVTCLFFSLIKLSKVLIRNKNKRESKKNRFRNGIFQKKATIIKLYNNGYSARIKWSHTGGYLNTEIPGSISNYRIAFLKVINFFLLLHLNSS